MGSIGTILDIKTHFLMLNPFSGGKYPNSMTHSLLERGKFVASYLQKQKRYKTQILHQECFCAYNESYKISFHSINGILILGMRA